MRYEIRSIPAVKLFVDGEVAGEFMGALPEPQVRTWLNGVLPSEVKDLMTEAQNLVREGDKPAAHREAGACAGAGPQHADAMIGLATIVVFKDPATGGAARERRREERTQCISRAPRASTSSFRCSRDAKASRSWRTTRRSSLTSRP